VRPIFDLSDVAAGDGGRLLPTASGTWNEPASNRAAVHALAPLAEANLVSWVTRNQQVIVSFLKARRFSSIAEMGRATAAASFVDGCFRAVDRSAGKSGIGRIAVGRVNL